MTSVVKQASSIQPLTPLTQPSIDNMIRIIFLCSLTVGLVFAKQLEPGQWHPAVESDGTFEKTP
jgi:hypothetical protein